MKKYFSLASALMLALGMGMTSCSNDLDEVVTEEQQTELHKLHLTASVPQSSETRSYIEGVENSDAIKITGWRDGDVIYGVYPYDVEEHSHGSEGSLGHLPFRFNGTTKQFDTDLTGVNAGDIKYFVSGDINLTEESNSWGYYGTDPMDGERYYYYYEMNNANDALQINVAENSAKIPMWGNASLDGEGNLTTDMQLSGSMAFICVHNGSAAPIEVRLGYSVTWSATFKPYVTCEYFKLDSSIPDTFITYWDASTDRAVARITTIPAGEKAYLPVAINNDDIVKVMIGDQTHDNAFKSKVSNTFTPGKVYKVNYTGE